MKRKILSLILVAAMLASVLVFVPTVGASTEPVATVDITETAGWAGDTVSVDVIITAESLTSFQGLFEYDKTRLTLLERNLGTFWNQDFKADTMDVNADFVNYTKDGSFASLCAASAIADSIDAGIAEGAVCFTLVFQINEDAPVGDAFIRFRYLDEKCQFSTQANVSHKYTGEGDAVYLPGCVTVLPEGVAPEMDPSAFEYENNGDGTCTIIEYLGDATILNIPSEIDGLTVTGIGSMIFSDVDHSTFKASTSSTVLENNTITTIIVPATVTTIGEWAFMNANVCSKIIICGSSLEYVSGTAFGAVGGTWRSATSGAVANRGKFNEDAWPLGDNFDADGYQLVDNVSLSIVNADSLGTDFATENGLDGNCLKYETTLLGAIKAATITTTVGTTTTTYTANAVTIYAPGGDASIVAWKDAEGNLYAPGADLGDVTEIALTAITVDVPTTVDGAAIRFLNAEGDPAMRFKATVSKATYETMKTLGTVEMGMLITPRVYVNKAGAFTMEALDALAGFDADNDPKGYVKVKSIDPATGATAVYAEDGDNYIIAASLKDFSDTTVAKNPAFAAVAYLTVTTAGGETFTIYGEYDYLTTEDVKSVAEAVDTDTLDDDELVWHAALLTKFGVQ